MNSQTLRARPTLKRRKRRAPLVRNEHANQTRAPTATVIGYGVRSPGSRCLLKADAAVFDLAAVAFDADGSAVRNFQRRFQYLAVAQAVGQAILNGDFDFVP